MTVFALTRRCEMRVPTLLGWLVILGVLVVTCLLAGRFVHPFLSMNAPRADARLLVVEGWLNEKQLDEVISVCRRGDYSRVITSGGPLEGWPGLEMPASFAELAADYLKAHGLHDIPVTPVPAPASAQDRTFLSAVMVRNWLKRQEKNVSEFDVYSGGVHARRTHWVYRLAFGPDYRIGIHAAQPSAYDPARWWRSSAGAKTVVAEAISLAWTACCFTPPAPGSHEEVWAVPPATAH